MPEMPKNLNEEDVRDVVGLLLEAGDNIEIEVDDSGDTVTITVSGLGSLAPKDNIDCGSWNE